MTASNPQTALVTGASSGIGLDLAHIHAARGGDLVLVARRREKLENLAADLEKSHAVKVRTFALDLSQPDAARTLFDKVQAESIRVDILVNNAGFGGYGPFHQRDAEQDAAMIRLNIATLTALTRLFLPEMVARRSGRILNVASIAGFIPGPFQAVYYATKAYVISFSEALSEELSGTGVTVTALCPGATETEFAHAADLENVRAFNKTNLPKSADVARYGYESMLKGRPVAVHGFANRIIVHFILRFMPRKIVRMVSRKTMEET